MDVAVRKMEERDVESVARVHGRAFPRQLESHAWIECNFRAYPRIQYFVGVTGGQIVGYIAWMQKSGFRPEVVLELEQMAVDPDFQGRGAGRQLIVQSLPLVKTQLRERGARLKHVVVTTRADNRAQQLYRSTLGAEVEATLRSLYSGDEVVMVARDVGDRA